MLLVLEEWERQEALRAELYMRQMVQAGKNWGGNSRRQSNISDFSGVLEWREPMHLDNFILR